jgi:hypothetical protein
MAGAEEDETEPGSVELALHTEAESWVVVQKLFGKIVELNFKCRSNSLVYLVEFLPESSTARE